MLAYFEEGIVLKALLKRAQVLLLREQLSTFAFAEQAVLLRHRFSRRRDCGLVLLDIHCWLQFCFTIKVLERKMSRKLPPLLSPLAMFELDLGKERELMTSSPPSRTRAVLCTHRRDSRLR